MRTPTFQVRTYHRLPVQCPVYFSSEELQGTGTLWNLSLHGCRIDGNLSVLRGTRLEVLVMLRGKRASFIVQEARVMWTRGQEFGLRLEKLRPRDATRLETYIRNNIS